MTRPNGVQVVFNPTLAQKNIDLYVDSERRWRRTVIFTMCLAAQFCLFKTVELGLPKWPALTVAIYTALVLIYAVAMARYVWRPLRTRRELLAMHDVVLVPAGIGEFYLEQNARIIEEVEDKHRHGLRMYLFNTLLELMRNYRALQDLQIDDECGMEALHRLNGEQRTAKRAMVDAIDRYARPTLA